MEALRKVVARDKEAARMRETKEAEEEWRDEGGKM